MFLQTIISRKNLKFFTLFAAVLMMCLSLITITAPSAEASGSRISSKGKAIFAGRNSSDNRYKLRVAVEASATDVYIKGKRAKKVSSNRGVAVYSATVSKLKFKTRYNPKTGKEISRTNQKVVAYFHDGSVYRTTKFYRVNKSMIN